MTARRIPEQSARPTRFQAAASAFRVECPVLEDSKTGIFMAVVQDLLR